MFDNSYIASPDDPFAPRAEWRHTADVGPVGFGRHNDVDEPTQLNPSLVDNMAKGQLARVSYSLGANPDGITVTTEITQVGVPVVTPQPRCDRAAASLRMDPARELAR